MFRKLMQWNPKPETHEDRLNSAAALAGYATDLFTSAAGDLEEAASQLAVLAHDAGKEADAALLVAGRATTKAAANRRTAQRLLELIGE